ncbi:DUF6153 family protein [Streptomyces sp. A5-4]|uniref:DUF6153 family protein n=1 Tax=Streptomyces sp. A5-4 TaxID=3384771 RepID=UPI003DA8F49F
MSTSRRVRAGGALGHLLLVVVLALGVFIMHTTGHPDEGSGTSTAAHASAMSAAPQPHAPMEDLAAPTAAPDMTAVSSSSATGPVMNMDMASLCVAVLTAWALAALLRAALLRRPGWLVSVLAEAVVMLRPNPPPRKPDLTQLSILRI